jgi:hypothetical protein
MSDSINDLEFKKFIDLGNGLRGIAIINYGLATDGPLEGSYVNVGAKYNTETGNYELLTAGSGSSTPVEKDGLWNSTNTSWNDTSINWNQE